MATVVIGDNEGSGDTLTGFQNLVVGEGHTFTHNSTIVAGFNNAVSGLYSVVSGESYDAPNGSRSRVPDEQDNTTQRRRTIGGSVGWRYRIRIDERGLWFADPVLQQAIWRRSKSQLRNLM
ncbi:MAG: hypothetical protein ACJAYU_002247 [Bradymonadia bacterium]|jgi:hypothetical protein